MISPPAASVPLCLAWHTPRSASKTTIAPASRATVAVASVLLLSTTISCTPPPKSWSRNDRRQAPRYDSSLYAGTTTLNRGGGPPGAASDPTAVMSGRPGGRICRPGGWSPGGEDDERHRAGGQAVDG